MAYSKPISSLSSLPLASLPLAAALLLSHAAPASAAPTCGTENLLAGKMPQDSADTRHNLAQLTDGVVTREGSNWNAPVVVELASPASYVTYDLGEPREISALFMQGDANDVYRISGSTDGSPGSFQPIGEFPNAVSKGHGLRDRAIEIAPTTVRYLRVGAATGDGYFSISELGAYCRKPTPFPPRLKVVDTPEPGAASPGEDHWPSFLGIYQVALLALAWLAYVVIKSARAGGSAGVGSETPSGDSSSPAASAHTTTMKNESNGIR
jgi:hypothetical protein